MSAGRLLTRGRIELRVGLCLVAAFVGGGATLAVRRSTPVEAGLIVAAGALDFGSAWEQPTYRHVFAVSNPTDRPIAVTEFATGCGCTTVEPRTFSVPPGGTQTLTATLDLTHRAGEVGAEFLVELLPTLAHQPSGERTVWTLRGDVRPNPIVLSEASLDFGDAVIAGEPPVSQGIAVTLTDGAPVAGLHLVPPVPDSSLGKGRSAEAEDMSPDPSSPPISRLPEAAGTAELAETGPRSWTLLVTPRSDLPIGPFEFVVRLEATGEDDVTGTGAKPMPLRDVEVTGVVRDDVSAWPASLNFGALAVGETGEEYVVLASHRGHGFAIERIESPAG
ncbi:MAG: DUF1573 domain-containing protein, partial [Planctomycetaceae bacterium]